MTITAVPSRLTEIVVENQLQELTIDEIDMISGGVDWNEVGTGLLGFGATVLAIAAAPETAGTSLLLLGAVAGGAGSGMIIGDGLSK